MKFWFNLALFFALPGAIQATDLKPWYPRDFEIQAGATELLQYYQKIKSSEDMNHNHTLDSFTTLSAEAAAFQYAAEVEMTLAHTKRQSFGCDNIRITGRYQLFNDACGDSLSSVVGLTAIQTFTNSLRDPSSFHHGIIEAEVFLSFGKETSCLDLWLSRIWGLVGFGCGDHGKPWVHGHLEWEKNWLNTHYLRLIAETLWGLGSKNFHRPFRGYGNIQHQSVDLGLGYSFQFDNEIKLSFDYSYRVYARNFPANANRLKLEFLYPFWL